MRPSAGRLHETDRLSQLAEDLLLLARADRGQLPLRIEPVDVDDLLGSVRCPLRMARGGTRKGAQPSTPQHVRVNGDRLRLEQALGNLVDNALRYGGDDIRLEAHTRDGQVELHVRDDGPGFRPQFIPHAFERFARADQARSTVGVGLGLSIVETIARSHGGTAHVGTERPTGAERAVTELDALL